MPSPAKETEAEFDDLLGQLVNELAMAPPEDNAVSLVPEQQEPAHNARITSTEGLAIQAAAKAEARAETPPQGSNTVAIVGIVTAALSAVAIAAMFAFQPAGAAAGDHQAEGLAVATAQLDEARAEKAAADKAAAEKAAAEKAAAEKAAAEKAAAEKAAAEKAAAEKAAAEEAAKAKKKPRPRRTKPKTTKPKPTKPVGSDFGDL
ncbi:histidinol-phosphate aminotransferase [Plesiocystis pacifica SIR-1]|uniref:Histidinol-phosphate aminotransferase n=1 Tax=Plesiocystis pacifica SIR-1 TaxID=391625 RepID=A6GEE6_9BACT|nr:hypothetical protein [Plesiocystis pacifica]EDM75787.1 histidinol-phosphate aminotransferase [Plesiocystis pacifica SIR-1]